MYTLTERANFEHTLSQDGCYYSNKDRSTNVTESGNSIRGDDSIDCQRRHTLEFAFLVWQWFAVMVLCTRIHMIDARNAAAGKFKQQARWFLFIFMVTTVQWLLYEFVASPWVNNSLLHNQCYLKLFGQPLYMFTGLTNAIVWGVSRSCMVNKS
jgi:hypothetical protein